MFDQINAEVEVQSTSTQQVSREHADTAFAQLTFLDNADLALIGGGGAHGGNFL